MTAQTECLHSLRRLPEPMPAKKGKPYIYQCVYCVALLKVASGVVQS